jgi:hypothetical protein
LPGCRWIEILPQHCRIASHIVRGPQHRCLSAKAAGPAGPVAQWLEPAAHNGLVAGSSPAGPTTLRPSGYAWRSHAETEGWSVSGVAGAQRKRRRAGPASYASRPTMMAGKVGRETAPLSLPTKISKTTPCKVASRSLAGMLRAIPRKHFDTSGKSAALFHPRSLRCFSDHQTIDPYSI